MAVIIIFGSQLKTRICAAGVSASASNARWPSSPSCWFLSDPGYWPEIAGKAYALKKVSAVSRCAVRSLPTLSGSRNASPSASSTVSLVTTPLAGGHD
jgi:hypothetical protein